ncbi:MAG: Holliday junction resolvase RuvX [Limisphaerales bacterium]
MPPRNASTRSDARPDHDSNPESEFDSKSDSAPDSNSFAIRDTTLRLMRILALDHGTVRIGMAVSDELGMLAHPMDPHPAEPLPALLDAIKAIIRNREIALILVGLPRNMDGSMGPAVQKVEAFVHLLRETIAIPVRTWDERLTTLQAHRLLAETGKREKERRGRVDSSAAAVLLQSYLDAQASGGVGMLEP